MNKYKLIALCFLTIITAFFYPYIFTLGDTYYDKLMLSFTSLASTATLFTLIIALLLYKKLSIDTIIIQRQANKVIELIEYLKDKSFTLTTQRGTYPFHFRFDSVENLSDPLYDSVIGKKIAIRKKELNEFFDPINNLCKNYWMPKEIKEASRFFETKVYSKIDKINLSTYCKFGIWLNSMKENHEKDCWVTFTTSTSYEGSTHNASLEFEDIAIIANDIISNKNLLIEAIEKWMSKNSNIKIDLEYY